MKHLFITLTLVAFPIASVIAQPELKGSPESLATYLAGQQVQTALTGEADVRVPADRAFVTLRLTSENKSLKDASHANQQLRAGLVAYLAEQGIGADRVQSAKFSSSPRTGSWSDKVKSYRIESQLKVAVHDDKEFQKATGAIDKWMEVAYVGVEFAHSEKETMRLKAVALACERAMARKKTYEEKLGVKLSVKRFNEGVDIVRPHLVSGLSLSQGIGAQGGTAPSLARTAAAVEEGTEDSIPGFGELVFRARVVLECSLEAR